MEFCKECGSRLEPKTIEARNQVLLVLSFSKCGQKANCCCTVAVTWLFIIQEQLMCYKTGKVNLNAGELIPLSLPNFFACFKLTLLSSLFH